MKNCSFFTLTICQGFSENCKWRFAWLNSRGDRNVLLCHSIIVELEAPMWFSQVTKMSKSSCRSNRKVSDEGMDG